MTFKHQTPMPQTTPWASSGVLSALLLWIGFLVYGSTGHDDSHITLWAAHSLLNNGELLNYNGDRVEQSSALLLTLLAALTSGLTGVSVIVSGYLVGIIASLLTCLLIAHLTRQMHLANPLWAVLLLGSSASFMLWTFSGMESTLTALCLLWMISCWAHYLTSSSLTSTGSLMTAMISTLLLLISRPEMPLLSIALCVPLLTPFRRRALTLLVVTLILVLALLLLRYCYFGSWFPQPVSAKQGSTVAWQSGAYYLFFSCLLNPVTLIAAVSALLLSLRYAWLALHSPRVGFYLLNPQLSDRFKRTLLLLSANALLLYLGFIWLSGGDWMQAGRFIVPVLPLACLLVLYAFSLLRWRWLAHSLIVVVCAAQFGWHFPVIAQQSHGTPVWTQYRLDPRFRQYSVFEQWNQEHVRDMAVINHLQSVITDLTEQSAQPITLLSGQSGMVFYYTAQQFFRQVQFYDLRGLVDRHLTDCTLVNTIERARQGLYWGYPEFFALLPQLESQCGIRKPDIIYDLNDMNQKLGQTLEKLGYVMIHQEQGFVLENATALPWNRLLSPNMIFIRADLLPLLHNPEKRIVRYPDFPLTSRNLLWTPY